MRPRVDPEPSSAGFGLISALVLCMATAPLLIFGLTAVSPLAVDDLGISRLQFGSFGSLTFAAAAAVSMVAGRLVDRFSERATALALHVCAALALLIAAATGSYPGVLVGVALSGAAMSLSNPVTNRLVSTQVPPGRRGLVMGFKQSGIQVAQLTAGLLVPSLAVVLGWRAALATASLLAIVALAVGVRSIPRPPRRESAPRERPARTPVPAVTWWIAAYALLTGAGLQSTNLYLPLFGHEVLGLGTAHAGLTTALIGAVGLIAKIVWGRVTEQARTARIPLGVTAGLSACAAAGLLLAGQVGSVWMFWMFVAFLASAAVAANVVTMVALLMTVPLAALGRSSAFASAGLYVGFGIGPAVFGWIVDDVGGYAPAWAAVAVVFALATALVTLRPFARQLTVLGTRTRVPHAVAEPGGR